MKMRDEQQLALFHRTLAELCRSEMPLGRAFALLDADLRKGPLREAVRAMAAAVERGTPLAEAYRQSAAVFPPLYAALVEVGIASGDLPGTLDEIARDAARRDEIRQRLRSAAAYPLVATGFVVVIGGLLVALGLGSSDLFGFAGALGHVDVGLPWYAHPGAALIPLGGAITLFAAGLVIFAWLRNPLDGARGPRGTRFRVPVVGRLRLYAALATLASTVGLLLRRGLPLGRALDLTAAATDDRAVRARVETMARAAGDGASLAPAMEQSGLYPPSLVWLIGAAEKRSAPGEALEEIAALYRDRLSRAVDRTAILITPVAEVLIGVVVLGFALSFITPMFAVLKLASSLH